MDTIGLSTQDYVMRSPQTLLVPLLVLTLVSAGFLALNARMFLVLASWSASDATLIVPLDGSVRVQFQFQSQAP